MHQAYTVSMVRFGVTNLWSIQAHYQSTSTDTGIGSPIFIEAWNQTPGLHVVGLLEQHIATTSVRSRVWPFSIKVRWKNLKSRDSTRTVDTLQNWLEPRDFTLSPMTGSTLLLTSCQVFHWLEVIFKLTMQCLNREVSHSFPVHIIDFKGCKILLYFPRDFTSSVSVRENRIRISRNSEDLPFAYLQ